uniref:Uncharacterized protein n=1 Tax=Anopheles quadriannulatus TaxID=34691 RepID=A0A182XTN1_ANOQN
VLGRRVFRAGLRFGQPLAKLPTFGRLLGVLLQQHRVLLLSFAILRTGGGRRDRLTQRTGLAHVTKRRSSPLRHGRTRVRH